MSNWDLIELTQAALLIAWTAWNFYQRAQIKKVFLVIMKTQYQNYILGVYKKGMDAAKAGALEKMQFPKYRVDVRPIEINKNYSREK